MSVLATFVAIAIWAWLMKVCTDLDRGPIYFIVATLLAGTVAYTLYHIL